MDIPDLCQGFCRHYGHIFVKATVGTTEIRTSLKTRYKGLHCHHSFQGFHGYHGQNGSTVMRILKRYLLLVRSGSTTCRHCEKSACLTC
jgi:hypothetical protein